MLTRESKRTWSGLAGSFSSTADSATTGTGSVTKLRKESSFAERTALVRRQTQGLEENEDWAQVAVYSGRTGLDGNHISLYRETLWIKRKYTSALTPI